MNNEQNDQTRFNSNPDHNSRQDRRPDFLTDLTPDLGLPNHQFVEGPRLLKMRCPCCNKLYSVEESWVSSSPRAPLRFECVSCKKRFEAKHMSASSMILETFEIPVRPAAPVVPTATRERAPLHSVPLQTRKCPKCSVRVSLSAEECQSCGVVFAKFKAVEDSPVGEIRLEGRRDIQELWDETFANYGDESYHERFVMACYEANSLAFAAQKYARILSASPAEETARKMRKRIISLASFKTEIRGSNGENQFRVPMLLNLILVLAGATITLGLLLPNMKSLTGIGIAAIALAIGIRFFLRPRRT